MYKFFSAGSAALLLLAGCANHLEDIVKETPENSRSVLGTQYILTMDREIPDGASFKVTLEQVENIKIEVNQVRKVSSLYTPYQGWRESYEFLAGIGLFPVAIVSNVISVFSFGMFPFSWSAEVTKLSFDGMNPCMNFESKERVEEIPQKVERTRVDSYTETKRMPLGGEILIVKPDFNPSWRVRTNQFGQAEIVLLSIDPEKSAALDSRHLDIYLESKNVKCRSIPMSRRLQSRLAQARQAMLKYYTAPDGKGLAACVKKLESLSLEPLAFRLEETELKKHPDFRDSFDQAIK